MTDKQARKILNILKPRMVLKSRFLDDKEVTFIEAKGFVFKGSDDDKLLKEWLGLEDLEYNKWYPIEKYYNNNCDWALVQFKEKSTGFIGLPEIAEYIKPLNKWVLSGGDEQKPLEYYLNNDCEAISFMLWQPFKNEEE